MGPLVVSFRGRDAEHHRLPAYSASQSLYGISRSLTIITNYAWEGRVRHRDFDASRRGFKINLVAQQQGSYQFIFEILSDPVARGIATKVAGDLIMDLIRSTMKRAVGEKAEEKIEQLEESRKLDSGDLGALVEAIEPAMKAAHMSIGDGASNIFIITGDHNNVILNEDTKRYVSSSHFEELLRVKLFSIGSYNANSRYGRAFDFDLQRNVPFILHRETDMETVSAIMSSMSSYALSRMGDEIRYRVALKYQVVTASDGRIKKMIVLKARKEIFLLE